MKLMSRKAMLDKLQERYKYNNREPFKVDVVTEKNIYLIPYHTKPPLCPFCHHVFGGTKDEMPFILVWFRKRGTKWGEKNSTFFCNKHFTKEV
jgi:hypothetical protein